MPEHLIRTISREGRRSLSSRAVLAERRRRAQARATRASSMSRFWRRIFGGTGRNMPILLIHQVVEEGGIYAMYL